MPTALTELFAQAVHLGLVLLAAPALAGLTDLTKARLSWRSGPRLWAPFRDLIRLSRKAPVLPENATPLLALSPVISLAAMLSAAALVPSITVGMVLSPLADGLVVAGLLTTARVAGCLAALDTGAASSGRMAERTSAAALVAEPALLAFVFALALMAGSFNLDQIIGQQRDGLLLPAAASALALTSLLALAFADAVADTAEIWQDLSGIDLAIARLSDWLRRVVWIDLIGALFLPIGMAGPNGSLTDAAIGLAAWLLKLGAATLCLAFAEALLGRPPPQTAANLLWVAALLAFLATVLALAGTSPA